MTLADIITMSYEEGLFGKYYSIEDARKDADKNTLAFHNRRHITSKSPHCRICTSSMLWFNKPHITIVTNKPLRDCMFCEGSGMYFHSADERYECPCINLQRPATWDDIHATIIAQPL